MGKVSLPLVFFHCKGHICLGLVKVFITKSYLVLLFLAVLKTFSHCS